MEKTETRLFPQQLELIQRHMPTVLIGNMAVSAFLCLVLLNTIEPSRLIAWISVIYMLTAIRGVFHWRITRHGMGKNLKRRAFQFVVFSLVSGLAWGSAGVLFFSPEQPVIMASLVLVLAGMVAGSVAPSSAYPLVYYSYAVPTLLPFALVSLANVGGNYTSFGLLTLAFLGFNLTYSLTIYKTILETLRLRLVNIGLIEALKEQKELAESANIAKSKFLAAASHDLRQPLHAQGLFLDSLKLQIESEKGKKIFQKVLKTRESLEQLFNGLLDISKLDAGVVVAVNSPFNVQDLLHSLNDEFTHQAADKGLAFSIDSNPAHVYSDRILLERIIRNLLSNAIRYTDSGEISVCCDVHEERVRIVVEDTGIGMPQEELENIFSEYHQLGNPERDRNKGLGLGLAIVDKLTNLLKIKLSVQSLEQRGTKFTLTLNVCEECEECELNTLGTPREHENLHIVVIDDELEILEGMGQMLDLWHYRHTLAESAEQAREKLLAQEAIPDIVVADYRLRENKTGAEAINLIRDEFNLDIPGIIISGDTELERILEAKNSGYRLLHKPVSFENLRAAINLELSQSPAAKLG